jgi:hypothetical protein
MDTREATPDMTVEPDEVDVPRRAGELPMEQEDLESWLAGHRERVEARGAQLVLREAEATPRVV